MRKTSYAITFFAVVVTLTLNAFSAYRPDWLVYTSPEVLRTKVTVSYGMLERCELQVINLPAPEHGKLDYTSYTCRPFPSSVTDHCEDENRVFCIAWTSAGYASELALGFAGVSLITILFGVSTHSRRRRIWKAVAGLVFLHTIFQILSFAIVTEMYRTSRYPTFEQARPGVAYVLNTTSWVLGILVTIGVVTTGIYARKGHKWAAGNRAYQSIDG